MAYAYQHGDRPLKGYTIQRAVGRGGFGEVYYALSDGGREVALKYLRDNPSVELRGVSQCMNLKSPHLVKVFDIIQNADGEHFIVMEYVQGPSLRDLLLAEPNGLGPQKAAFLIRELAKGLGYLHDHGIVHRDLKPGNVFYDEGYVKIGDYGLSKFISVSAQSGLTANVGTVHYMAPEIGSGKYHAGIDIYAVGVMLYEMLLGRVPYRGTSMAEVLMKHLTAQPAVDHLPTPFGEVIKKALAKDPEQRYGSIHELAEALLGVAEVRESLDGFEAVSLTNAVRRGVGRDSHARGCEKGFSHQPAPVPRTGRGIKNAFRSLANSAGDALKAAAGVPYGTPPGGTPQLSPEAASGHLHYAGFWVRAVAALIDVLIVGVTCKLFGFDRATAGILFLYQAILIGTWNGQTIGKRACGLKVISDNGCHPTLGQAFGRALGKLLNVLTLMIGYLIIMVDGRKRGLHDRVAGTLAVHAVPPSL